MQKKKAIWAVAVCFPSSPEVDRSSAECRYKGVKGNQKVKCSMSTISEGPTLESGLIHAVLILTG